MRFKNPIFGLIWIAVILVFSPLARSEEISPIDPITAKDRILIFAPHPDDEAIAAAGIIQRGVKQKVPIKVIYLTNGDSNESSFMAYEKRLVFGQRAVLQMGEIRREEAIKAMEFLGLRKDQLVFLGYPDLGTTGMFINYWGDTKPYISVLSRVNRVPYPNSLSYQAPYVGESFLSDLEKTLLEFKPTKIFISHPADTNGDHRSGYLFLQVALWDLKPQLPRPKLYSYLVHAFNWPNPLGYRPHENMLPPPQLSKMGIKWHSFTLTEDEIKNKEKVITFYQTQISYNPRYLYTFVRQTEIFGELPHIVLPANSGAIDWNKLKATQGVIGQKISSRKNVSKFIDSVTYARQRDYILVRIKVKTWEDRLLGIHLYLVGYKVGKDFSDMPKYRIRVTHGNKLTIYEKRKQVIVDNVEFIPGKNEAVLKFPISALGNPDYIFSCAKTSLLRFPLDTTAWRILELGP